MKKGDISNKRAFGVGADASIFVEATAPTNFLDKLRGRKSWRLTNEGRKFAEALSRLDYRLVVFVVGRSDVDLLAIDGALDALPLRVIHVKDDLELGNEWLRDVDVYFTDNVDFFDVWRYFKNVRLWYGVGQAMNYLRTFE